MARKINSMQVQDLDFAGIKEKLIEFMRGRPEFTDYDFTGANLNFLMDALAYNTHMTGFTAHMLNNESTIQSAGLKSSLNGKAKDFGYTPKSRKASSAEVKIDFTIASNPAGNKIIIPRGTTLNSTNNTQDGRTFVVNDDIFVYNRSEVGIDYGLDNFEIIEGRFKTFRFLADESIIGQKFIIFDETIDISTLRVRVFDSTATTSYTSFDLVTKLQAADSTTPIYHIGLNHDEFYELFFGNGVYGQKLVTGNVVEVSYVATNGVTGNNAKAFELPVIKTKDAQTGLPIQYDNADYNITTVSPSDGGLVAEDIEELRFNIPNNFSRQNRNVTPGDYQATILSEFRNVSSLNVWGGEDHIPPEYDKMMVSIKPKFGNILSTRSKNDLIKLLKEGSVGATTAKIIDPDFLDLKVSATVRYNPTLTSLQVGELQSDVEDAIRDYNTNNLNKFNTFFSSSNLNGLIAEVDGSILTSYLQNVLSRDIDIIYTTLTNYSSSLLNKLLPGSIKSGNFTFRSKQSFFADDSIGNIVVWYFDEFVSKYVQYTNEEFGTIDYETGEVVLSNLIITNVEGSTDVGTGKLNITATPVLPDYYTKRNNIISITTIMVDMVEDFKTERNKV